MGSTSSIPDNEGYIKANPYPSQKNEQPFLYQQNCGSLVRKSFDQRSRSYINDIQEQENSDSGVKDHLEAADVKDGS